MAILAAEARAESQAGRDVYQRIVPSCAWVIAGTEGRGTGWLIDAKRKWLITNSHVVGDATHVEVAFPVQRDGKIVSERDEYIANLPRWRIAGKVIKNDPNVDLALIELNSIPGSAKAIPLASGFAGAAERVHMIGNRRDLDQLWTYTTGLVSQRFQTEVGYPWRTRRLARNCRLLGLQAPINEGDSGGPVVNDRGEALGVASAILWQAERIAVAIDVSEVRRFVFPEVRAKPADPPPSDANLYRQLIRTVALVRSPSTASRSSGVVIDMERRLLLTTAQQLGPNERVELIFPRYERGELVSESGRYKNVRCVKAGVVVRDARRNLALLEAESAPPETSAIAISSSAAKPGDSLHSIGNPNGIDALWLYTALSVRQTGKIQLSDRKEDGVAAALVLQGPGSANDGGGPIVDDKGRLVAVAGGKDGPEQQVNYALDVSEIRGFLDSNRSLWDPRSADEFQDRGHRRMRIRQDRDALADFRQSLHLVPSHRQALIDLADLYTRRGEIDKALATIGTAMDKLAPSQRAIPLTQRAAIEISRGHLDVAMKDCDAAIMIDKKCARAFAVRAEVWRREKDLAKALADAEEAAWLDANLEMAYLHRGLIHMQKRDLDAAQTDFTRAIELDPFDPEPLQCRAMVFEMKGDSKKAERDRNSASRLK